MLRQQGWGFLLLANGRLDKEILKARKAGTTPAALGQADQDWVTNGLYWSPIEPDVYAESFHGVHLRPSPVPDSPASTHMAPSYPR